ncbi:ubiquinone biosynthesis O-methyltransferase, mitochondrial-like isoform X2 [Daphnia pulicaria]|uniref:ubiquinone biosynthesis O-methyltransferase, mitochondrial-like isoform X2 n=1 Tax=Daphnia pulicaria TaxID=35523 RepID=UPI001EEB08BE|nr:ubiquinone biosynthesis O-methyltransferase, mitochondrial-like isoform X2 [Daphnia pulicaria]
MLLKHCVTSLPVRGLSSVRNYSIKSTLSENEIQKFSKMANEWWDVNGPFSGLHSLNKLRVPFIRNGICSHQKSAVVNNSPTSPLAGCSILDVGCGGGILSTSLGRLGASVTGLDPSEENTAAASLHANKMRLQNVTFEVNTIEHFQALNTSLSTTFDAVVASEVIEHVENPKFFIQTCTELLKPGGSLFITTLNRTPASWALAICGAEYILNVVPRGTHDWNKFITPDELIDYINSSGCQLRQICGMAYNPFMNKWKWSRTTSVNYAVHATKSSQLTSPDQRNDT